MASNDDWKILLDNNADLIIIGGFINNPQYDMHYSLLDESFSLRIGRLCKFIDQKVFHVKLNPIEGMEVPQQKNYLEIDMYPTEHVLRDYSLIFNTHSYKNNRRVIGVAGIKGTGARAAACFLTSSDKKINKFIKKPIKNGDNIEMIIKSNFINNIATEMELIDYKRNGITLFEKNNKYWEKCELNRECSTCNFAKN